MQQRSFSERGYTTGFQFEYIPAHSCMIYTFSRCGGGRGIHTCFTCLNSGSFFSFHGMLDITRGFICLIMYIKCIFFCFRWFRFYWMTSHWPPGYAYELLTTEVTLKKKKNGRQLSSSGKSSVSTVAERAVHIVRKLLYYLIFNMYIAKLFYLVNPQLM